MKKITTLLCITVLLCSICACGNSAFADSDPATTASSQSVDEYESDKSELRQLLPNDASVSITNRDGTVDVSIFYYCSPITQKSYAAMGKGIYDSKLYCDSAFDTYKLGFSLWDSDDSSIQLLWVSSIGEWGTMIDKRSGETETTVYDSLDDLCGFFPTLSTDIKAGKLVQQDTVSYNEVSSSIDETMQSETNVVLQPFDISLDELKNILDSSHFTTYEAPDFTVYREGIGSSGVICFSPPDSERIEVVFFLVDAGTSRYSYSMESAIEAQNLLTSYCDNHSIEYLKSEKEENGIRAFMVAATDSSLDGMSLPLSIRECRSPDEFLANDERRQAFKDMLLQCRYTDLYRLITEFIDENKVVENDIVYDLQADAKVLSELADKCEFVIDTVENKTTVFYKGVNDISSSTNLVPFLTSEKYGISMECKIGFERKGWLFFDELIVAGSNIDSETKRFDNTHRDVLGGGMIQEYIYTTSLDTQLAAAIESGNAIIRFKDTDTREFIDHVLTDDEKSAFPLMQQIDKSHTNLYYTVIGWEGE